MPTWVQILIQTAIGLAIAIATAVVTTRLALNRFRAERWWERKVDAYTQILDSLFDARQMLRSMRSELVEDSRPGEEQRQALESRAHAAWRVIEKHTTVGSFLISREAAELLQELALEIDGQLVRYQDLPVRFEVGASTYDKFLPKLRDAAMRDLRLRR